MRKLQQFLIPKFNSSLVKNEEYNLQRTLSQLQQTGELVSLGDSQILRHIRTLTNHPFTPGLYQQYLSEVKEAPTKSHKISSLLYIPQYLLIQFDKKYHYTETLKNLTFNDIPYTRILCSAGMARTNTVAFVPTSLFPALYALLNNSRNPAFQIQTHKFNAYSGLAASATHIVSEPKPLLIADYEEIIQHKLDYIYPDPASSNGESIEERVVDFEQNFFDGCGLIHPTLAEKWAKELELVYIPSYFIVRAPYLKGCLFTMDFHDFPHDPDIEDYYGQPANICNHDIILTKSMFKLADAYQSMEHYLTLTEENNNHWGVTRVAPKRDPSYFTSNYQFLQGLNIREGDIEVLSKETVSYIVNSSTQKSENALIYLLSSLTSANTPSLRNIPPIAKALILNPALIGDPYIQSSLKRSFNKKIREAYMGKLFFHGNYSIMIPDLFAFVQHLYGQPVTGYIPPHCCSAPFYPTGINITAFRAPLTWRSECNPLKTIEPHPLFKYQTGGIMYCARDESCILHADRPSQPSALNLVNL